MRQFFKYVFYISLLGTQKEPGGPLVAYVIWRWLERRHEKSQMKG